MTQARLVGVPRNDSDERLDRHPIAASMSSCSLNPIDELTICSDCRFDSRRIAKLYTGLNPFSDALGAWVMKVQLKTRGASESAEGSCWLRAWQKEEVGGEVMSASLASFSTTMWSNSWGRIRARNLRDTVERDRNAVRHCRSRFAASALSEAKICTKSSFGRQGTRSSL